MKKVLIVGGSGFVGQALQSFFRSKSIEFNVLSRNIYSERSNYFQWIPEENYIDLNSLVDVFCIINLSGENISEKPWTNKRKKQLYESRILTSQLLFDSIQKLSTKPEVIICASAIGYYESKESDRCFDETSKSGSSYLSTLCVQWEESSLKFISLGLRTIVLRFGIVLGKSGGAFPKLLFPAKFHLGTILSHGRQFMPYIHIDDLCNLILHCIEVKNINGIYNAVNGDHVTNESFCRSLANKVSRFVFIFKVPRIIIELLLGKMSTVLLDGNKVSSKKIEATGFLFQFKDLNMTFDNILKK